MFNVESYIEEVQSQIEKFKEYLEIFDDYSNEISPEKLNKALAHFSQVNFSLNAEYQRFRAELKNLEADFQEWFDKKFIETKTKLLEGKTSSYKLSQSEIETQLRAENQKEHRQFFDKVTESKMKTDFLERLMKQWSEHGYNLKVISDNLRSELRHIGDNDRGSKDETPSYSRRIRG